MENGIINLKKRDYEWWQHQICLSENLSSPRTAAIELSSSAKVTPKFIPTVLSTSLAVLHESTPFTIDSANLPPCLEPSCE